MRLAPAILVMLLLLAPAAHAGAWLRDKGAGFLVLSVSLRQAPVGLHHETGVYGEYGARPRLTLGIDINNRSDLTGHALGFVRLPLSSPGRRTLLTLDLGVGGHFDNPGWNPMARATLSLGRNFASGWGGGWVGIDAAYGRRFGQPQGAIKLDAAIGLSSGPRFRPLLQVESYHVPGVGSDWTATASVMIDGRRGRTWVIGLQHGSTLAGQVGIKAGLWRSF